MKVFKKTDPWFYALEAKNDYLSPEDITAAIKAGGEKLEVWEIVLDAISANACEDLSCCAFVAVNNFK